MQKVKAELIGRLCASRRDPTCMDFTALLDILIQETREGNDTAEGRTMLRNQGKIEGFKELKDIIVKGLPISY